MLREPDFVSGKRADPQPVRILLLEDDPHFADLLRAQLRRMRSVDSRLEVAGTLAEALARLAADSFGLVLADLDLPDAAGLKTVEALARSGEQLIVVLTGIQDSKLRAGALEAGAYDFLTKDDLTAAALERLMRLASIQANTYRSLRESEARFRGLVALSSDWYWEQDEALRFKRFEGRSGPLTEAAIGKRRWEVPGLTAVSCSWQEHRETLEARRPFRNFEYSWSGERGEPQYVSVSGEPVYDALGRFRGYRGLATDTTGRKRAEEDLRRFRLAMDNSADVIVLIDRATMRFADVNVTACKLLGYSREELLAMGPHEILPVGRAQLEKSYDAFIADPDGAAAGMRSHYRCKDGSLLPFESTRRVLRSDGKWFIAAISRDLRDSIASEKALQESEARKAAILDAAEEQTRALDRMYAALSGINEAILRAGSAEELLRRTCEIAVNSGNFIRAMIRLVDRDSGLARLAASAGRAGPRRDVALPVGENGGHEPSLVAVAYRAGRPVVLRDLRNDPRVREWRLPVARLPEVASAAAFPLRRSGECVGVLVLHGAEKEAFDGEMASLIERLAENVSFGLQNIAAQEDLRRFRLAMDSSADMIVLIDRATMRFVDVNRTVCSLLGYTREEMLSMSPQDVLPVTHAELEVAYDRLIADPSLPSGMNSHYRCKDGSLLPFESTRRALRSADGWLIAAISRDIRERLAAEKSLRDSEARFRSLTALSSDWYWEQDAQLRLTYMSTIEGTGLDPSAYLGRYRWDQPALNLTEEDWARHRAQLERHEPFHDFEMERAAPGGGSTWVSLSGEPVSDEHGRFAGYRGVGRNITQRKRTELEVRRLGRMYAALGAANEAILRAKAPQEVFDRACEIAVEAGEFLVGSVFLADAHGGTLSRAAASGPDAGSLKQNLSLLEPQPGGLIEHACRAGEAVISNDYRNDPRFAARRGGPQSGVGSAAAFPLFVEDRIAGVFGLRHAKPNAFGEELAGLLQRLADNISFALESLQRDARLLASEARFRGLTRLSSDTYWAQDSEYRFTDLSGSGSLAAGRQRMLGKRRWEEDYLNMSARAWEEHKALLDARLPFRDLELGRIGPSGEKVWVSSSGEPVFDEQGAFAGYRGVAKDISARKNAERLIALEHRVTRCLAGAETATGALREVMRAICESENWDSARYFRHDEAAGVMRFEQAWSIESEAMASFVERSRRVTFQPGEGLVGHAWKTGEPLWAADIYADPRAAYVDMARAAGLRGTFVFPLAFDGSTIGVLAIASRAVRQPDERLLQTLRVIGSQLAQFLRRKQAEQRQAEHLHFQEKLSRFGQSALGRRQPAELVGEAVQSVLETLGADAVAYFEPGPEDGEAVLRALVGAGGTGLDPRTLALGADSPILGALRSERRTLAQGAALVPVRGENHTRGVLCVCALPAEPFSAEALNFIEAMASVLSAGLQRIDSEGRLAYLAQFDPLTGLPNRALLADRFSQMIVQARRRERPLGVLFIDLDEFKLVNDTLGHAGGDELLKEVAVRLQSAVRPGDTVARISGDEFAVVLADLARPEDAALVAQKVIERLAAPVDVLGQEVFVTASVGIAGFPGDGADAEALIGAADAAMYRAKQSGRNAFQFFTAEINQRSRARAQLGAELRRALEREEFALVYQPKFRLADRSAGGAEALLRWRHPERGMVSPAEFIPVLEETGLIVAVGEWVLRRACEDLKAWRAAGLEAGAVAVNLSARQFRLPDLDVRLKAVVAAAGVDPALIELEITESQLMQDPDHAIRVMRSLRESGMRIAIDDFGTGYSSLAYLTRFPVGSLKIDRSFVARVNEDASAAAIVRTIIEMAHTLGFTVVAEGIETEAQADYLRRHRCEQGQGYLFARPMGAQDLAALLAKHCT